MSNSNTISKKYAKIDKIYNQILDPASPTSQTYEQSKINAKDTFGGIDPARWLGYLVDKDEESGTLNMDLLNDVLAASEETGIDPYLLYSATMQEGMASELEAISYGSGDITDTYIKMGLDGLINEIPRIMKNDILNVPIPISPHRGSKKHRENEDILYNMSEEEYQNRRYDIEEDWIMPDKNFQYDPDYLHNWTNEKGMKSSQASITNQDAFRAVAALLSLNKKEFVSYIGKDQWENMPREAKDWWLYTTFNAGTKEAKRYWDSEGSNMYKEYTGKGLRYPLKSPRTAGGAQILRELGIFD